MELLNAENRKVKSGPGADHQVELVEEEDKRRWSIILCHFVNKVGKVILLGIETERKIFLQ